MADRRPMRFWGPFNDWWRTELERLGRRPDAQEIVTWYNQNAGSVWGDDAPTLLEARVHAKALRPVTGSSGKTVKDYFRRHRAQRLAVRDRRGSKGGQNESDDYDDYDDHYASPAPPASTLHTPLGLYTGTPDAMGMMAMGPAGWGMMPMPGMPGMPGLPMPMGMGPNGAWDPAAMASYMAAAGPLGYMGAPMPGMMMPPGPGGDEGPASKRRRHTTSSLPDDAAPEAQVHRRYSGPQALGPQPPVEDAPPPAARPAHVQPAALRMEADAGEHGAASPRDSGAAGSVSSEGVDGMVAVVMLPPAHEGKAGAKTSQNGLDLSDGGAPPAPHASKHTPHGISRTSPHGHNNTQHASNDVPHQPSHARPSPRGHAPAVAVPAVTESGAGLELLTSAAALVSEPEAHKAGTAAPVALPIPAPPAEAAPPAASSDSERQQQELVASYMFAQAQLQAQQMLAYQLALATIAAGSQMGGGPGAQQDGAGGAAVPGAMGAGGGPGGLPNVWGAFGQAPPALLQQEVHSAGTKRGRPV